MFSYQLWWNVMLVLAASESLEPINPPRLEFRKICAAYLGTLEALPRTGAFAAN